LGKVKWHTVRLRDRRREVAEESYRLHKDVPARKNRNPAKMPESTLAFHNAAQAQGAGEEQRADQGETQRQFITVHLRGRPQPAKERVLAVRRPTCKRNTVHAQ